MRWPGVTRRGVVPGLAKAKIKEASCDGNVEADRRTVVDGIAWAH